ncbi:hypothetical protein AB0Q95_06445 [Streptomyces sp. NPDC059900]|uniref:hypothetical protein n=1 Tax=Streptomyces sp. NPDC059900 TaxID=3155816 RepID=UPI003412BF76
METDLKAEPGAAVMPRLEALSLVGPTAPGLSRDRAVGGEHRPSFTVARPCRANKPVRADRYGLLQPSLDVKGKTFTAHDHYWKAFMLQGLSYPGQTVVDFVQDGLFPAWPK